MAEARVLYSGLAIGESPRWHDGKLWLRNTGQVIVANAPAPKAAWP